MQASNRFNLASSALKPLAACVAAMFGLAAHEALATIRTVTNCNDSGTGSLREVIKSVAQSGDTVDMSGLTSSSPGCSASTISLHTGAITIPQNDLTLKGPGEDQLTIFGKYQNMQEKDRILNHTGTGELDIIGLTIESGYGYSSIPGQRIVGGCIESAGDLFIARSTVTGCRLKATGSDDTAYGGAIYAANGVFLSYSSVIGNKATAPTGSPSGGGGVYSKGPVFMTGSTIAGNTASFAGGMEVAGSTSSVTIFNSTISGNHATRYVGGLLITDIPAATTNTITNSTIAGNSAAQYIGGVKAANASLTVQNSTIAFNTAAMKDANDFGAGLYINDGAPNYTVTIESSIFSNNTVQGVADDLETGGGATTISGANNLVYHSDATLPANFGLAQGACPLLGPLANNGGYTQTLALLSGSPAMSHGNNSADLSTDQRGAGFSRTATFGGIKFTDIGAYEVQGSDIIFNAGFDGCP